jgi:superfamily II DNA or RNA helicase/HKD family nuclease
MVDTGDGPLLEPGLYESLITETLELRLEAARTAGQLVDRTKLDPAEAPAALASYLANLIEERLATAAESERIEVANAVIGFIDTQLSRDGQTSAERLDDHITTDDKPILRLVDTPGGGLARRRVRRPEVPLTQSDLLINGRGEPNLISALISEVDSADRVRIIVSFIKWSGLILILPELERAIQRGAQVQVLTTTYLAASDQRAINALVSAGAEVRISYDGRGTRLHAKAWLFDRNTGFHTGYIGSSNMSVQAMSEGMEWNVRLSEVETPHLLAKFRATFDAYWQDPVNGFEPYDPDRRPDDPERLRIALEANAFGGRPETEELLPFDLNPYPFQEEMLDDLRRDREVYGCRRNLVVAATGTGKTIIAAFDYRRLAAEARWTSGAGRFPRLLFVAHRKEILTQSRRVFRQVLKDANFGELLVDGETPRVGDHVFASIQSLTAGDRLNQFAPDFYDIVIVDEFHHATAQSYDNLLQHVNPRILLGLTATPERMDGQDVTAWFDGRIATELRLWEALERDLLVPFHYFAVGNEELDFSRARWSSGSYNSEDLEKIYTGNDVIVRWVLQEVRHKVTDPTQMKALVFTSGVNHADFVARHLNDAGIHAIALNATTPKDVRAQAVRDLRQGVLQAIVTVDLFNEGVDIPEVDTVLMLRPTESGTVFLQQLGRGLRKTPQKSFLTVLDFIGNQRKEFRYDIRFRALTGVGRRQVERAIADGFPYLPAGAFIQLDEVATRLVIDNIKSALPTTKKTIAADIRQHAEQASVVEYRLQQYLADSGLDLVDIYGSSGRNWTELVRLAGLPVPLETAGEAKLLKRVATVLHIDDQPRLAAYRRLLTNRTYVKSLAATSLAEQRLALMLYFSIWPGIQHATVEEGLLAVHDAPAFRDELLQVWDVVAQRFSHVTQPLGEDFPGVPLSVHARYSRAEMLTALGLGTMDKSVQGNQSGVIRAEELRADVFNVTWQKVEGRYSPHTMYRDYAVTDRLIHWQSQHADRQAAGKIQRYIHHRETGDRILLFARETPDWEFGTRPYLFLGTAQYVSHAGERPVSFVWQLDHPLPTDFFLASKLLAG